MKVDEVSKTPIQELLEVRIGNELFYVDSQANYVILEGRMINLKSGKDLTAIRLDKILTIDFKTLPLELAIKTRTQTGAGAKNIKCPYCGQGFSSKVSLSLHQLVQDISSKVSKLTPF